MTSGARRSTPPARETPAAPGADLEVLARRHLSFGLFALVGFSLLGVVLEGLHGFKVSEYLAPENDARRLSWRLAHAHGALFAVLNVVIGLVFASRHSPPVALVRRASPFLTAATLLLPGGFLLGGVFALEGDPGVGIFLVPVGALCLFAALVMLARGVTVARGEPAVTLREISHDSWEYDAGFALRRKVLREPLGLSPGEDERREEASLRHVAAFAGERLVGCLMLMDQGRGEVRMRQVAVDFDWQGRGIGRSLVRFSEDLARRTGFSWMVLNAREHAVPFYERLGYACTGEPFIEVTIPHRRMRKPLTPSPEEPD